MSSFVLGVDPTITSAPAVSSAGENITITGTNFDPVGAEVYFDTIAGSIISRSTTQIVVTTPPIFFGGYVLRVENRDIHYAATMIDSPSSTEGGSVITQWFAIGETAGTTGIGEIVETVTATSADENLTITIPAGTIALDKDGDPLYLLTSTVDPTPPPPPEGASIIGQAYDLGPRGAIFDPPIIFEYAYDPALIPEGVTEEDLVLASYDGEAGEWVELPFTIDPAIHTITGSVRRLTTFAILAPLPPTPAPTPAPAPAAFSVSNLSIQPTEVLPKEAVIITVLVANTGGTEGSYTVALMINGVKEVEKSVTVAAGDSQNVSFTVSKEDAGGYSVSVDGLSGSFTTVALPVELTPAKPINWLIIGGIIAGLIVVISLIIFLVRRQRPRILNGKTRFYRDRYSYGKFR